MRWLVACLTAVLALGAGCSSEPAAESEPAADQTATPSTDPTPTPTASATADPSIAPDPIRRFDADRALRTVRDLAVGIGPRPATGPAYREAASYVADALDTRGYAVRRESFPVPAGDSWGVPVEAGRSANVVAEPSGFDPAAPYVLVGAHLDTVAVAPGAEDNASGVAVLLELARVLGAEGQVVLVAFGAEEPVGPGELHHFGSKHHVAELSPPQRRNLAAMVSLDRVGVGDVVPLSHVEGTAPTLRDRLARIAGRIGIATSTSTDSASDHESFADAGFVAARVGSTPYAGYHSADDLPRFVGRDQLDRVGRLLTAWLRASWTPRSR
ncbi:MAG: M28 family peptidase [Nocardioides sp.]